jgi:hypothetical protein
MRESLGVRGWDQEEESSREGEGERYRERERGSGHLISKGKVGWVRRERCLAVSGRGGNGRDAEC